MFTHFPFRRSGAARTPVHGARRAAAGVAAATIAAALLVSGTAPATAAPAPLPDWRVTETMTTDRTSPRDLAAAPDGAKLFVGYEDEDALGIIDLAGGVGIDKPLDGWAEPILTVPAPDGYRALAAGTNNVYSVTPGSWDIASAGSPGIEALAYSGHQEKVFSVDGGLMLSERDPLTGALLRWASLDDYLMMPALAAHPSRPVLYATSADSGGAGGTLTAIDLDGIVVWDELDCECLNDAYTTLELPDLQPVDVKISPDGSTLYVLDSGGALVVVDTDSFTAVEAYSLGGMYPSASLSVNPVTGEIVLADLFGTLSVVDPVTFDAQTVDLEMGLWDTAISADGTRIFVTNTWESTISVLQRLAPPPAPATDVRATPGARQAAVFWNASVTTSSDLQYTVTATGGTDPLCTTAETFCIVTGLPAGPIQFTVTATTAGGSAPSLPSAAVTITAPAAPATVPAPTSGVSIAFAGDQPDRASVGQAVQVIATGFAPGSYVDVSLHSLPMLLGSGQVGSNGSVTINGVIPAGTPTGAHHLVASGFTAAGAPASAVRPITLSAASGGGGGQGHLPRTGADAAFAPLPLGALMLAAGAVLAIASTRRSRRT